MPLLKVVVASDHVPSAHDIDRVCVRHCGSTRGVMSNGTTAVLAG